MARTNWDGETSQSEAASETGESGSDPEEEEENKEVDIENVEIAVTKEAETSTPVAPVLTK